MSRTIDYLDRPPPGWFALEVFRCEENGRDWAALMVDADDDERQDRYRRGLKVAECWVRIAGKHKSRDAAWDALDAMITTRH